MKTITLLLILCTLFELHTNAQIHLRPAFGFHQGDNSFGEVSIYNCFKCSDFKGQRSSPPLFLGHYFSFGSEFNFKKNNDFVLGPKIGYNFQFFLLQGGLSTVYYTNFKDNNIVIQPHIGFSLLGWLDIEYSYNFKIDKVGLDKFNKHSVSLTFRPNFD